MKDLRILSVILFVLGIICFGLFFVFKQKDYLVVFDSNGGTSVETQRIKENELVVKPTDPIKEGSEFVEWNNNGKTYDFQTAVTSDLTLKAIWKNVYSVIVLLEGSEYTTKVTEGNKLNVSSLNLPEREGYTIKYYLENGNEYNTLNEVTNNIKLNASYVALQSFTVKFDSNGGNKISDIKVWEGSLVTEPTVTRSGYVLDGWYNGNVKYDFNTPINANLSLKAKWNEAGKVTVTFESDGKTYKEVSVKENTKVSAPAVPTKKGYIFVDWQLNGSTYDFSSLVTSNMTLVANFREEKTFTVTFVSDGKTYKTISVTENTKVSKPTNPTKSGYEFVTWLLNNKEYNFNNLITSDITLEAKWQVELPKYTVSFNTNGGSTIKSIQVKQNQTVTKPTDPIRAGYKFLGWKLNNNDNSYYDFKSKVTKDITLYAQWRELEKYIVSFDVDGGSSITSQLITEGDKAIKPNDPTKENYRFVEWQLNGVKYDFNKAVTGNISLKAKWEDAN